MKVLKFLICMTSKDIAFLIDSGSFLEPMIFARIYTSLNLHSYDLGFYSLFHLQNQQTSANSDGPDAEDDLHLLSFDNDYDTKTYPAVASDIFSCITCLALSDHCSPTSHGPEE